MPPTTIHSTRTVVGMEVHVELATRSKMFTRAANVAHRKYHDAAPNSLVDPVVAALPGALPVMNKRAVELSIMVGLALNCEIPRFCKWDRKNYFYPDLPKGYQISQYDLPLCVDGWIEFPSADGSTKRVRIVRAHLEEDAGKLGHELPGGHRCEGSLVDLNRAGTPLLEIVSHPDLDSAEDAVTYGRELRNVCRFLGVTEGIMQRGHMRFEPNINVIITTSDGAEHATPIVEIKNLNSFRSLRDAIEHEATRQVEAWKQDGVERASGNKTTRGWDVDRGVTVLQREKEEAHDYRYLPDPDLAGVIVDEAWRDEIAATIPELPRQRRERYERVFELKPAESAQLTDEYDVCMFYEACLDAGGDGRGAAKLLLNAGAKRANERGCRIDELGISPEQVTELLDLRARDVIGSTAAEELFGLLCETNEAAATVAETRGLVQERDEGQLDAWIDTALAEQPQAATDFAAGKDAAAGRIIGAVMKASGGKADAKAVREKLVGRLRS
ncbi:MAG: Asp-tRNA(Asn)/Glu-tRNA(Gln) amidotransferase subunit GatB [Planctomycetes bacterium]|nr:Asp-tRNA(Asn)/Glu-tRNA(Gln) amidotransferase subunit GatB [Planctomycetota bacterium]